jgi:hypothetical protein
MPTIDRPGMAAGYGLLPESEGKGLLPWSWAGTLPQLLDRLHPARWPPPRHARLGRLDGGCGLLWHRPGFGQRAQPGGQPGHRRPFGERRRSSGSGRGGRSGHGSFCAGPFVSAIRGKIRHRSGTADPGRSRTIPATIPTLCACVPAAPWLGWKVTFLARPPAGDSAKSKWQGWCKTRCKTKCMGRGSLSIAQCPTIAPFLSSPSASGAPQLPFYAKSKPTFCPPVCFPPFFRRVPIRAHGL